MIDLRQTPQYAKYMSSLGWTVEGKSGQFAYIKKFPFIGSFIKIQRPEVLSDQVIKLIKRLSKKYRAFQIVIEPQNQYQVSNIKYLGVKQQKTYFVPSKTIQIDLTKSEKQLLKEMHYKTRYNITKNAKNPNFKIQISKDIDAFAKFWQKCALEQRGMFLNQKKEIVEIYKAFGKNAHIITITKQLSSRAKRGDLSIGLLRLRQLAGPRNDRELLAAVLVILSKNTAYYMYAASTSEGKKMFAPTIAAWEAIKLAKKLKKKVFDFEGIYDDRFPVKSWLGFTRFKKSFGGKEIIHPGTFTKFRFPV